MHSQLAKWVVKASLLCQFPAVAFQECGTFGEKKKMGLKISRSVLLWTELKVKFLESIFLTVSLWTPGCISVHLLVAWLYLNSSMSNSWSGGHFWPANPSKSGLQLDDDNNTFTFYNSFFLCIIMFKWGSLILYFISDTSTHCDSGSSTHCVWLESDILLCCVRLGAVLQLCCTLFRCHKLWGDVFDTVTQVHAMLKKWCSIFFVVEVVENKVL